ncbi:hypothetical protein RJ640_007067 [Escallonia rubra]|uniref:WW domain-containing protein n=1 Tax=Escallonia rubra TaxID=112253 RepID=A0AA88U654_9ASTE|nr:hypothetical protein RJ640_007067 [Escallonia rubra]
MGSAQLWRLNISSTSSTTEKAPSAQLEEHSGRSPSASTAPPSPAVGTPIAASEDSGQEKYVDAPVYVNPLTSLSCNMLPNDQTTSGSSQLSLSSPAITPTSPGSSAFLQPPVPGLSASAGPSFSYNISQAAVCLSSSQQLQSRMNAATDVAQESSGASSAPSPSHSVSQSAHTTSIPASLKPSFSPTTFWTPTAPSFQMPPGVPGTPARHGTAGIVPSVPQLSDMTLQSVSVNSSSVQSRPTVPFVPGPSNSALQQHTYSPYPSVPPLAVHPQGLWLQPPQMSGSSRPSLLPYLASFSAPFPLSTHGMPLPSVPLPDSQPPGVTPVVFPGGTSTSSAGSGNLQAIASGVHPEVPPGIDSCKHVDSGMVKDRTPVSEQLDAWTAHRTGTGAVYYYNALTGESTYEKPSGFIGESSAGTIGELMELLLSRGKMSSSSIEQNKGEGPAEQTKGEVMELFFSDSRVELRSCEVSSAGRVELKSCEKPFKPHPFANTECYSPKLSFSTASRHHILLFTSPSYEVTPNICAVTRSGSPVGSIGVSTGLQPIMPVSLRSPPTPRTEESLEEMLISEVIAPLLVADYFRKCEEEKVAGLCEGRRRRLMTHAEGTSPENAEAKIQSKSSDAMKKIENFLFYLSH